MKCSYSLQDVQNLLANGKSWYELRSGESLKGPIVLFGALVGYLPKTPRETKHELVKLEENYYGGFYRLSFIRCGNLGRRYSDYWCWRIGKFGVIEIYFKILNAQELLITQRDEEFVFPVADGSAKLSGENYEFQEPTLRRESTVRRENLSGESHGDREEFQPEETKDDEGVNKDFWAHAEARKDFLSHHVEPRSSVALAEKRIMSYSTEFFWCHQVNLCRFGDCSRKENLWKFGCQICQIRGRVSQDLRYWTKLLWKEKGNPGEEENWREFKQHHVQITYGLTHWQQFWKQL